MFDGSRGTEHRYRGRTTADNLWAHIVSSWSLEGIISFLISLAIILALLNYVIIPQFRVMTGKLEKPVGSTEHSNTLGSEGR